jgi:hypothetical protein
MIAAWPVLAQGGEVIGVIIFIVIAVLSALGQLLSKLGGPAKPGQPAPPQPQRPLAEEIEGFLRQAGVGRPPARKQRNPPQPSGGAPPRRGRAEAAPQAVVVVEEAGETSVAEHVRQRMAPRLRSDLGKGVAEAEKKFDAQLRGDFEHRVGTLSAPLSETSPAAQAGITPTTAAPDVPLAGLVAALANPATLRQAVVLNEILQRPERRWG